MIARPKMSQIEWKTTEMGPSKVWNFSPFCCPGFARRDAAGAEEAYAALCVPAISSPNGFLPPRRGLGGDDWCDLYSSVDVVRGRWTPKAIDAYARFLASRNPKARASADARPFAAPR